MDASEVLAAMRKKLKYDPSSGRFTWLSTNDAAGTVNWKGYRVIYVGGRRHRAHRLAWLWTYGVWPTNQIDHIDRNKDNNAITNLRDVTGHQNRQNVGANANNTSGAKGVSWNNSNCGWTAKITVDYKDHYLGTFPTVKAASLAYQEAAQRFFTHSGN